MFNTFNIFLTLVLDNYYSFIFSFILSYNLECKYSRINDSIFVCFFDVLPFLLVASRLKKLAYLKSVRIAVSSLNSVPNSQSFQTLCFGICIVIVYILRIYEFIVKKYARQYPKFSIYFTSQILVFQIIAQAPQKKSKHRRYDLQTNMVRWSTIYITNYVKMTLFMKLLYNIIHYLYIQPTFCRSKRM